MHSNWNTDRLVVGKRLTDRKIEEYRAAGWYSPELKAMRRERAARRAAKRDGNFLLHKGNLIYSPQ